MFWKKKKTGKYKCPKCGKGHDQLPAIGFNEPHYYSILNEQDKEEIAEICPDFCTIRHPEQTDRFIRAFLRISVNDACEDLDYGVWVSVSEKTFDKYRAEFKNTPEGKSYFGRISNVIVDYKESTLELHVNIKTLPGGIRPELIPHESEHQLVKEWQLGITIEEAKRRVNKLIKRNS